MPKLYVINDILHNCQHIAGGRGTLFRSEFEKCLPEICEELSRSEWAAPEKDGADQKDDHAAD